ncbi:tRNA pseudouridine32 synthase / 23S rRNA pseudouridine746 synthase [Breoghania corrubedonensis]|uniref:Dual-specificity RNA pseudouridine synthase RluA n=1 Tax=Breoghania corrubedonensis TaxID=665038 RepID=A0A2T5UYF4_9HYPH|nr:pseudouridine synthase [Breoghania corrubedonensis]PTW56539.1 tRNA pseudouridine32 synthase / 23S rRNA pseudouridine746 synthase [Breoghania corrubedonensis]
MPQTRPFVYDPPKGPLVVLHADADILVVAKPSGLLSTQGKAAEHADCLIARINAEYPEATLVHRLDCATSGVMVFARNRASHRHLGLQFERRKLSKTYVARVWGSIADDEGVIDKPLRCDWPNRPKQIVDFVEGRPALTRWHVEAREAAATRVRLLPQTGRSHQLRVHMADLGHPILGDALYADDDAFAGAPRLQLHAETLTIRHPVGGEPMTFIDPCPF